TLGERKLIAKCHTKGLHFWSALRAWEDSAMRLSSLSAGASGTLTFIAVSAVAVTTVVGAAIFIGGAYSGGGVAVGQAGSSGGHILGAPGPVAGVGLPGIIVVGYGAYWLGRRHRRKSDSGLPRGDLKE